MTNQDNRPMDPADLRQKAEAIARERAARTSEDSAALSPGKIRKTLHKLRVHQIELEMQNEELRTAQEEIEAGRARYFDLYDLAPVGYCTLSEQGLILEANLTAATLLGVTRGALIRQPLSRFIRKDDQDIYYRHRQKLFETGEPQECELRLVKPDGALIRVHLTATATQEENGAPACRCVLSDITERKRAEEELKRFKIISDNAVYGNAIADLQGNLLYVNRFFANIHGYEPEELVGKHLSVFHSREQMEAADRLNASLIREGQYAPTTVWHCHQEGTEFPMLMSAVLIKDDYGNPQFMAASAVDMTAHHQASAKLAESENLLSRAQEIACIGSWKLDLTANRLTWSDEVYRIFGCKPQEFAPTYEAFLDFVHPQDRAAVDEAFSRSVIEGSDGYEIEHRIVRRNSGEVRHVHERCAHERNAAGAIIQSTGMVQDITERQQAEEALRASEEKFRSIFSSMTEIVVLHELVCDEDSRPINYRILDCNPAFTRITGIRREDAVDRLATDVYGSEKPPYLDEYARVALTGEPSTFITAHAPMDKHFDIHTASPAKNMFVTVTTDITERKQAETYREMGREILQLLNEPDDLPDSIQRVLAVLKTRTGVDAAGLRLQEGEDFPYFAQDGFPEDFLLTENTLVERGKDGGLCRDKDGNVSLECTCGLVLSGKTDPSSPLFTQGGSSWTNDSFPLLDLPSDQDPRRHPRNNCIHQGYASVALIPVRISDRIVGLIQLNDKRKDRFSPETIEILEGIAAHIGSALMRKQTEEVLRQSEEKHRLMFESMAQGVVYQDRTGYIFSANPAAERILSLSLDQMQGRTSTDPRWRSVHEDGSDFPGETHPAMTALRTGREISNVVMGVFHPASEEYRWINIHAVPQFKPGENTPSHVYTTFEDITEQKLAEQALRESLQTADDLVTAIPSGLFIFQFQEPDRLIFRDYNPEAARLMGPRISGWIGCEFLHIWKQRGVPELKEKLLTVVSTDNPLQIEAFHYKDKQVEYSVKLNAFTMPQQRLGIALEDITERNRLATIVDNLEAGVIQLDHDNRVIYCNPKFRILFSPSVRTGYCPDCRHECLASFLNQLPEDQAAAIEKQLAAMATGRESALPSAHFTIEENHFEYSILTVRDNAGDYSGALFFIRDITTEILERRELIEQEKQSSLSLMVAGIAHDLNNPLDGLQGCLRRIRQDPENRKQTLEYLNLMDRALDRMGSVIRKLVSFSGKETYVLEPINLAELLDDAAGFVASAAERPQVNLSTAGVEKNLWVRGDLPALFNVFFNILLNAYGAIPKTGRIEIRAAHDRPEGIISVEISDTGTGIPETILPRIFDPFVTGKKPGQGSGLGLPTARRTILRHGGGIEIKSETDQGTTVRVTLPALENKGHHL